MGNIAEKQPVFHVVKGDCRQGIIPVNNIEFPDKDSAEAWLEINKGHYGYPLFIARVPKGLFY